MIFDAHIHLDFLTKQEQSAYVQRLCQSQVKGIAVPGCDVEQWQGLDRIKDGILAAKGPACLVGYGLHPYFSEAYALPAAQNEMLERLSAHLKKGAAFVGEIGLDKTRGAPQDVQIRLLRAQLKLAEQFGLPAVLHQVGLRDAFLSVLAQTSKPIPLLVHGFSGDVSWGKALIARGAFLGVGAPILNPARARLRQAAKELPLTSLLVETDEIPTEAREAGPLPVERVIFELAALRGISPGEVAAVTAANFGKLYGSPQNGA